MTSNERRDSRLVGILGGMGPAATADFYSKLIRSTSAEHDQDHLRIVIWADPTVPSRQDALLRGGTDPSSALRSGIEQLVKSGAEIIVSPCNTAHAYLPAILATEQVEFISIVDATIDALRRRASTGRVGLLATDAALVSGIFQVALTTAGFDVVTPSASAQAALMDLVAAVKAGHDQDGLRRPFEDLLVELREQGATAAIAGCTELSTLIDDQETVAGLMLIDPSTALAAATVERARSVTA